MELKKILLAGLASTFLLTACGSETEEGEVREATVQEDTDEEQAADSETDVEEDTENEEAEEDVEEVVDEEVNNEGVIARQQYTTDWSETWHDVEFAITDVSIVKMEQAAMEEMMLSGDGLIGVNFVITNNGERAIDTYPDQGSIVVNGSQYDANMFASDDVGGELLDGVTKEGVVAFEIDSMESVDDITELRITWPASDWESDDMDDMDKDFDVTLEF